MSFLARKKFWARTAERAVKTTAQTAAATITANATGVLDADWTAIGSVSALAGLLSLLTSIGSGGVGDDGTPSLVD